jgi:hypothetical protein
MHITNRKDSNLYGKAYKLKAEQVVHILLLALSVLNVTMTWKFNSNETNENNRKEGSESKKNTIFHHHRFTRRDYG